jgi:hypothetical protein
MYLINVVKSRLHAQCTIAHMLQVWRTVGGGGGIWRVDEGGRSAKGWWMEEEPTGSGDLTVRPVCGFQTPWSYLPLGFRTLYDATFNRPP